MTTLMLKPSVNLCMVSSHWPDPMDEEDLDEEEFEDDDLEEDNLEDEPGYEYDYDEQEVIRNDDVEEEWDINEEE